MCALISLRTSLRARSQAEQQAAGLCVRGWRGGAVRDCAHERAATRARLRAAWALTSSTLSRTEQRKSTASRPSMSLWS